MAKKLFSYDDDDFFDFPGDLPASKPKRSRKKKAPKAWSIVTALDAVLEHAEDSGLDETLWKKAEPALAYLREQTGLTNIQLIVVAILVEKGEAKSWGGLAEFLGCRRLTIMTYSEEIEELVDKGWLMRYGARDFSGRFQGFKLVYGVVTALRKNQTFVPESFENFTHQQLIDRIELHGEKWFDDSDVSYEDNKEFILRIVRANPTLPISREILSIPSEHEQMLFILTILDYSRWADSNGEGLNTSTIDNVFPADFECGYVRKHLTNGKSKLFELGLIENKCEDGIVEPEMFTLTSRIRNEVLSDFIPSRSQCSTPKTTDRDLVGFSSITHKDMFYNPAEDEQVKRLANLLLPENFWGIQERLEKEGMRKGFACLFFGAPGTGKTETVLQLARMTGRDVLRIEIAGLKDKFVGESEKNIKNVFRRYKALCHNREKMPILFFNEADAIFGCRMENTQHSVDKMENAMQNIILQELENLEGILIATTNLSGSLDPAFERRFLFKIEFQKPKADVKAKIWKSMFGDHLTEDEAIKLASKYDFSGGQIENIARKRTIDYILEGAEIPLERIEGYCDSELIGMKRRRDLGFRK